MSVSVPLILSSWSLENVCVCVFGYVCISWVKQDEFIGRPASQSAKFVETHKSRTGRLTKKSFEPRQHFEVHLKTNNNIIILPLAWRCLRQCQCLYVYVSVCVFLSSNNNKFAVNVKQISRIKNPQNLKWRNNNNNNNTISSLKRATSLLSAIC